MTLIPAASAVNSSITALIPAANAVNDCTHNDINTSC